MFIHPTFHNELSPTGRLLLARLSYLPAATSLPFNERTAAAIATDPDADPQDENTITPTDVNLLLEDLANADALDRAGDPLHGLYTIPSDLLDLARAHDRAAAPQAVARYFDYTVASAYAASDAITPHRGGLARTARHHPAIATFDPAGSTTRAMDHLLAALPTLDAALDLADEHGEHQAATNLVYAMFPVLHRHAHRERAAAVYRRGLAHAEAWGDPTAIRSMALTLGTFLRAVPGATDEAIRLTERAMDLALAAGDHRAVLHHRRSLAACRYHAGDCEAAAQILGELLPQYDLSRPDDSRQHMLALILLGSTHSRLDNPAVAIRHLTKALHLHQGPLEMDPLNHGRARLYLGEAHGMNGDHAGAMTELARAQPLFVDAGAPLWSAHTFEYQSNAAAHAGRKDAALDFLQRAGAAYERLEELAHLARLEAQLAELRATERTTTGP
ncbi:tetratricopeptide repeat protein [Kitasatospora sp. NPDC088783]|uniref:tetratricopeptide repeat protein n=1 Tax=Kitasatospora sp. NPDC088783 TaxID=3364077 RepID=UPI0037FC051F